jgi:hypothetical protein
MPHIEKAWRDTFKSEIFNKVLGGIERHVAEMDLVPAALIEQAGDQRSDFPGTEDEYTIHHDALYSSGEF